MKKLNRRDFVKLAAVSGTAMATGLGSQPECTGRNRQTARKGASDFSPVTNKERQAIPSACWQCVTRDAMIGYVEDGRVVKAGRPSRIPFAPWEKLCAKGAGRY